MKFIVRAGTSKIPVDIAETATVKDLYDYLSDVKGIAVSHMSFMIFGQEFNLTSNSAEKLKDIGLATNCNIDAVEKVKGGIISDA